MAKTKRNTKNKKNIPDDTLNTVFKPLRPENYIFGGKRSKRRTVRKTRKSHKGK